MGWRKFETNLSEKCLRKFEEPLVCASGDCWKH